MKSAIEKIEKLLAEFPDPCEGNQMGYVDGLKTAIHVLRVLPAEDGWVSVKERLPTEIGEHLVIHTNGGRRVDHWDLRGFWGTRSKTITHWMKLPDDPSEG